MANQPAKVNVSPLQAKQNTLISILNKAKDQIEAALPKHLNPDRMLRIAMTEVRKNPKLAQCDPLSFLGAVIQSAQVGLEIGSGLDQCYIIPYGNEVQFQLGYKGMIELSRRSGEVSHVNAFNVGEGDEFEYGFDLAQGGEQLIWKADKNGDVRDQTNTTHTVAHAKFKDGEITFDVMTNAEVEKVRSMGKAKNSPAWKDSWGEMAKKTAIKRLWKKLPKSAEVARAIELDNQAEIGKAQDLKVIATEAGINEDVFEVAPSSVGSTEVKTTSIEDEI